MEISVETGARHRYLGLCRYGNDDFLETTNASIRGRPVYATRGNTRCLHAIGLSPRGAKQLVDFSKRDPPPRIDAGLLRDGVARRVVRGWRYMDVVLEEYTRTHPAVVVRYDLQSHVRGHRGVFFQDRGRFASQILPETRRPAGDPG